MSVLPQAQDQVLSTLRQDGRRIWLKPRLAKGTFLRARLIVAWALILLFQALPWITISGKPAVLLDILHRRFTILGYTFLPTDTLLLALFMLFTFVSIFLFTALFGRLWCGWACPQTVYLEFVYRPLERLFDSTTGRGGPPSKTLPAWRKPAYLASVLVVSFLPAHSFLAYFIGIDQLLLWVRSSPFLHPTAFVIMAAITLLMVFNFYFFREQLCILACPYGRFQSVLLDRFSMIVSYDRHRGEPRTPKRSINLQILATESLAADAPPPVPSGDCIDCNLCVAVCPTGIDIRKGLQMECVNCTQCMDACDTVMTKISRPRGLIRYASQAAMEGQKKKFRPRLIFYPALLLILSVAWVLVFESKGSADVTLMRNVGNPFTTMSTGLISNSIKAKLTNRTDTPADYTFAILGADSAQLVISENPMHVPPDQMRTEIFRVELPQKNFHNGICDVTLRITGTDGFLRELPYRLLGPADPQPGDNP